MGVYTMKKITVFIALGIILTSCGKDGKGKEVYFKDNVLKEHELQCEYPDYYTTYGNDGQYRCTGVQLECIIRPNNTIKCTVLD